MSSFEATSRSIRNQPPSLVAFRILEERVKELSQELPGVTFGYIGNLERWCDNRSWAVFLPHPARVGGFDDQISIGARRRSFQPPSTSGPRSLSQPASVITTAAGERDVPCVLIYIDRIDRSSSAIISRRGLNL
jgi:hypothetical protein